MITEYLDEGNPELEELEEQKGKKRKRNTKKTLFSVDEKKKLAMLVQQHPSIWNLQDKLHSNLDAVNADWRAVSVALGKTVDDCKIHWKSLRDSHRYHKTANKLAKSGSAANNTFEDNEEHLYEDNVDWEFCTSLSFLTPASSKRRTFTNDALPANAQAEDEEDPRTDFFNTPCSSYTYNTAKKTKMDPIAENVASLTQTVTELINMRKEDRSGPSKPVFTHHTLLANLDRILEKLPDEVVEELGLSFQQQAVAALRDTTRREK